MNGKWWNIDGLRESNLGLIVNVDSLSLQETVMANIHGVKI